VSSVITVYITDGFQESNSPLTTTFFDQFLCCPLICLLLSIDKWAEKFIFQVIRFRDYGHVTYVLNFFCGFLTLI